MRQREAAAELERAAAAEKAKIARDRPAVVTVEEIVAQRAAAIEAEGAAWLSEKKARAGQWSEEKEKAAQEEGRQSEAKKEKVIPLHERWAPPKKEGLVKRIISARREAAAERQREQDNKAWETSRPEREQQERARRAWIVVESPYFQKLPVGQQREIGARWDEQFPPPHEIESPWEREKRIDTVMRGMNQAAYDRRQWDWTRRSGSGRRRGGRRSHWSGSSSRRVPAILGQRGTTGRRADIEVFCVQRIN